MSWLSSYPEQCRQEVTLDPLCPPPHQTTSLTGGLLGSVPVSASCISVVDPGPGVRLEVRNSTFRGNGLLPYNATGDRSVRAAIAVRCTSTAALGRGMACSTRLEGVGFDGNTGVLASAAFQWCRYANCTFQLVGVTVGAGYREQELTCAPWHCVFAHCH